MGKGWSPALLVSGGSWEPPIPGALRLWPPRLLSPAPPPLFLGSLPLWIPYCKGTGKLGEMETVGDRGTRVTASLGVGGMEPGQRACMRYCQPCGRGSHWGTENTGENESPKPTAPSS